MILFKIALALILQPFIPVIFTLLWIIYLYFYKKLYNSQQAHNPSEFWNGPLRKLARFWQIITYIWHGYEIEGLENLPKDKPVLIIFYHSSANIDTIAAVASIFLKTNRKIRAIVEKSVAEKAASNFLLKIWLEATGGLSGPIDECVNILKNNEILAIAPGGTREMVLSNDYKLIWGNRKGFAKVALEAKVPIVLLFTKNCKETNIEINLFPKLFEYLYEKHKFMYRPLLGWFPVKLKTFISKPIEYNKNRSAEELAELVQYEMKKFIQEKQNIPGSIILSLIERFKPS